MCKCCENITEHTACIYYVVNAEGRKIFCLGTGDSYYDPEINFCPYCGRKLEE